MKTKPLKLEKDGTLKNVSGMSDKELLDDIKAKVDEDIRNYEGDAKKIAEFKSIYKEAIVSMALSTIVSFALLIYCWYLIFNVASTFSEGLGIVGIYIAATSILEAILTVLIETRHKEGYQELKEQASFDTFDALIDTLDDLYHQSKRLLTVYTVRYIYNEFIDTEEFDDIDDETKVDKIHDFYKELLKK